MKKIAILGTRGIPASYSGFETSVEETSIRLVEQGYNVTVFCRSNHYSNKLDNYKGVNLKYFPSIKSKHLDTVTNTFFSVLDVVKKKYDIIILYGIGNAYFLPIIKLFCKNVISVVDGADWERSKWGSFAKFVLRNGRNFVINFSNYYVVDNELLAEDYEKRFNKAPVYIPYGARIPAAYNEHILKKFSLEKDHYIIFIGRFVKEKGIDFLLENYSQLKTNIKLVVVGGNDTDINYVEKLKMTKDERIIFPGFVYGEEYESLLKFAKFYVSCSFLEGTSPSLLSAMAINGYALVSNLPENLEVLKGTCQTFKTGDSEDFKSKMKFLLEGNVDFEFERKRTSEVIEKYYTWEKITEQYLYLFRKILDNN